MTKVIANNEITKNGKEIFEVLKLKYIIIGRAITQSNDSAYMFKSFCDKIII